MVDSSHPDWGTLNNLSEKETSVLRAFALASDVEFSDRNLLRFLRARKFNPDAAIKMLREDHVWRDTFREHGAFERRDFPNFVLMAEEGLIKVNGRDKAGRPCGVLRPAHFHPSLVSDDIELVYFAVFVLDGLARRAEEQGQDGFTAIVDMEDWGMSNFSLPLVKLSIELLQDHYPERLGTVMVVNPPWVFKAAGVTARSAPRRFATSVS